MIVNDSRGREPVLLDTVERCVTPAYDRRTLRHTRRLPAITAQLYTAGRVFRTTER